MKNPEYFYNSKTDYGYYNKKDQSFFKKKDKPKESNAQFFDVLRWRLERQRSNIIIVVGEQGAGKSNTSLHIAKYCNKKFYNKEFKIETHLFHSILEFTEKMPKLRNSFVMLEECGVELNSKDWREAQNRVFRDIIETFRIYKISLVMTLPNLNDLDKSSRYLSHFIIRMNFPGNAIIFRKFSSFLTDKQKFMPVWKWEDIPDIRRTDKKLWEAYDQFHENFMVHKRVDWLEDIKLRNMKKDYKKQWYERRTKGVKIEAG